MPQSKSRAASALPTNPTSTYTSSSTLRIPSERDQSHDQGIRPAGGSAGKRGRRVHFRRPWGGKSRRCRVLAQFAHRTRAHAARAVGCVHGGDARAADRPPRGLHCHARARNASRTKVGIVAVLTIWRVDLVKGRIVATMSTIWKRACRLLMIPF